MTDIKIALIYAKMYMLDVYTAITIRLRTLMNKF